MIIKEMFTQFVVIPTVAVTAAAALPVAAIAAGTVAVAATGAAAYGTVKAVKGSAKLVNKLKAWRNK